MAGGTWISQNKVRPGAYFNFIGVAAPSMPVGERGIGILAVPLNWGAEGELIEVYSMDLSDGSSLAKIGSTAFDEEAKVIRLMLSNCYKALVYRLDTGGIRATATSGNLTAQAKYPGIKGNMITIVVTESDGVFTVTTFVDGISRHSQQAITVQELIDNNYVSFSGFGDLVINAGMVLTGGTNGIVNLSTAYPDFLALARKARWQTMALTQGNEEYAAQFATFADQMRNDEGKYVQVVVANYDGADNISVINSDCGVMMGDVTVTAEETTAWVAGITAGAAVNQSNVARIFTDATRILRDRTNSEIIDALKKGMFILSVNTRGDIVVEDDLNSLHTFTSTLSEDMRLNQVVRVLDEIGTSASDIWEQSYKGKVQNNVIGRNSFKSVLIGYFNELQNIGAIENFAGADDITVEAGKAKDSVLLTVERLDPVAAMSKLYGLIYMI